jgi:hypothetical protein
MLPELSSSRMMSTGCLTISATSVWMTQAMGRLGVGVPSTRPSGPFNVASGDSVDGVPAGSCSKKEGPSYIAASAAEGRACLATSELAQAASSARARHNPPARTATGARRRSRLGVGRPRE